MAYAMARRAGIAAALRQADAAPILCFHNVVSDSLKGRHGDASLHLGASAFAAVVDLIRQRFEVVSLDELQRRSRDGRSVRGLASLTFDDAYRGVFRHAVPVLRRYGLPATIFAVTGAADDPRPFWWDVVSADEHERTRFVYRLAGDAAAILSESPATTGTLPDELLPADWRMLEQSLDATVVIGCHTATHRNLSALPDAEIETELRTSRDAIAARFTGAMPLAYPYGVASSRVVAACARFGFAGAVTLGFGRMRARIHPHAMPRVNVPAGLGIETLDCWTAGLRFGSASIRLNDAGAGTWPSGEPVTG